MNPELLKRLQLQAGGSHYPDINPDSQARFAEMIVQECISKYDEWAEHSTDKTSFTMARHAVKKHFGVAE
jgi:hypothetical protein